MAAGGTNWGAQGGHHGHPRSYDEYMKAYSVAMLPGRERDYLSYGGKSAPCFCYTLCKFGLIETV